MGDLKVETVARLAQVRFDGFPNFCPRTRKSVPFKLGLWNWRFLIEKCSGTLTVAVQLLTQDGSSTIKDPPIATFVIRILPSTGACRFITSPVLEMLMGSSECKWTLDTIPDGKFIVQVEFHDLKMAVPTEGEPISMWPTEGSMQNPAQKGITACLSRMLKDGVHTDVRMRTECGVVIGAHQVILAARSPVFEKMFQHDLKKKLSSTIDIPDMSEEACRSLLGYLYGTINYEDFQKHRTALMRASHKYDIQDLMEACEESFLSDIYIENVLQRLEDAWLYDLRLLKRGCVKYLLHFGKVNHLREEMTGLLHEAKKEFVVDILEEIFSSSMSFSFISF